MLSLVDRLKSGTRLMASRIQHVRCSFCGRNRDQVEQLVAGPGVYICDQCIDASARILAEARAEQPH